MGQLIFRADVQVFPGPGSSLVLARGSSAIRLGHAEVDVGSIVAQIRQGVEEDSVRTELASFDGYLDELLGTLKRHQMLALPEREMRPTLLERFDRLLAYWSAFETESSDRFAFLERMQASSVLLAGMGSLGTWAASHLACNGIGELVLVDGDRVELSNLNRQILYRTSDVGESKVECARRSLAELSTETKLVTEDRRVSSAAECRDLLARHSPSVLVLSADEPRLQVAGWFARAAAVTGTPMIRVSAMGVGPFYVPTSGGPCPQCYWGPMRARLPEAERMIDFARRQPRVGLARGPVFSPMVGMYASACSQEVIAWLTGYRPLRTEAAALHLSPDGSTFESKRVDRDPACECCGE